VIHTNAAGVVGQWYLRVSASLSVVMTVQTGVDSGFDKVPSKLQKGFMNCPWGVEIIPNKLVGSWRAVLKGVMDMAKAKAIVDADEEGRSRLEDIKGLYAFLASLSLPPNREPEK
jgi:hypothetical protein